jgi:transposase
MSSESAAEFRRRRAVELLLQGEPKTVVSRILGVRPTSLDVWMRKAQTGESLKRKPGGGRPRRLNGAQLDQLRELLAQGATSHGWKNNLWTTLRVREVIRRHFAIEFCRSHVWHIVTDYLGWSAIRPAQQAAKRDEAEIARWKTEEFTRIERQAKEREAYLVFVDESGFMMTPTIRRTFAPRGSTPVNKICDPHGRVSVIGAITVSPMRTLLCFRYHTLGDNVNFRGPSIIEFLQQLRNQLCGPISIVWDQIIIHSSGVVLDYLRTVPEIVTEFFPPYSPELNPVDRAWFYLKYDRLPNYAPTTIARLRSTVGLEKSAYNISPICCAPSFVSPKFRFLSKECPQIVKWTLRQARS